MINPDPFLCPTHKCEMEEGINRDRWHVEHRICPECKLELYNKITALKLKRTALRRTYKLSKNSKLAGLFEGL